MSFFDEFFEQMLEEDMKFCETLLEPFEQVRQELLDYLDQENENQERCKKNGKEYVPNWEKYEELTERYEQAMELSTKAVDQFELSLKSDNKENVTGTSKIVTETSVPSIITTAVHSSRPKRAAFLDASKSINKQVNMKLREKLRREDVASEATNKRTTVKAEKLSTIMQSDDIAMPPPQSLPIKLRPNRRIKKEHLQISDILEGEEIVDDGVVEIKKELSKNSDIILQEPRISLVDLTLSESSLNSCRIDKIRDDESSSRATYVIQDKTSDKQLTDKRNCGDDNDVKSSNKRSKSNTQPINENCDDSGRTQYDDAVSTIENNNENINATYITESTVTKSNSKLNTTVILHKEPVNIPDSLLTDDESDQEPIKSNTKPVKTTKQVFSAFEQSPVKKKVEAFEKLGASANNAPIRVTRTKTRALEKQLQLTSKQQEQSSTKPIETIPTNNVKEKAKFFSPTPINSQQTTIKTKLDNMREKANEKRQARLQQLTEAKRRKREEKELKAQQQREALEREKLKQLHEQEKLKEERHRKLLLEQEQKKKQKLLQEAEQKRLLAKQKAIKANQQQKPIYLTMETPRLPTNDCYDSDEEDYHKTKTKLANWAQGVHLEFGQLTMINCGEKIKNTFFSRRPQTVNLENLFQTNNPRLLKRTSSALWTVPPKYSILPTRLETTLETSNDIFEEEEED